MLKGFVGKYILIALAGVTVLGAYYYSVSYSKKIIIPGSDSNKKIEEPTKIQDRNDQNISDEIPESVKLAKQDLAQILNVDESKISIDKLEVVDWPNGSLGCPKSGYFYTQAIVPGYKVIFSYNQKTYEYHTDKGKQFIQCEQ